MVLLVSAIEGRLIKDRPSQVGGGHITTYFVSSSVTDYSWVASDGADKRVIDADGTGKGTAASTTVVPMTGSKNRLDKVHSCAASGSNMRQERQNPTSGENRQRNRIS